MPLVYYYQGRPASTWIAAMSRRTRGAAANPAGGTSPASRQRATPAAQRSVPAGISARAVVSASVWEAWAANWFTGLDVVDGAVPGEHRTSKAAATRKTIGPAPTRTEPHTESEVFLAAVIAGRLDDLADRAGQLGSDPQEDFFAFLAELVDSGRANLALAAALGGLPNGLIEASAGRLSAALQALSDAAQRTGVVRQDVDVAELHAIITGVLATESRLPASRRGLGLEIAIRGLHIPPNQ